MTGNPLPIERLRAARRDHLIGRQIHYALVIDSTNRWAKELAAAGAAEGALVITEEQTAGKGRLGRRWLAPARSCLLLSIVFRPEWAPAQATQLTMLCSLAAAEAIETETGLGVGIKWPNDLVVAGPPGQPVRKLAGLLTETATAGDELLHVVVGMGINVNLDPADLGPVMTLPTSLQRELGRPVDRGALLLALLGRIENRYTEARPEALLADWKRRLVTLGQQVTVTSGTQILQGQAEGVDPDGALLLRDLAGFLHRIAAGDVSLRPPPAEGAT